MKNIFNISLLLAAAVILMLASGCAGTKGSSKVLAPVDKQVELSTYKKLEIDVTVHKGVYVQDYVKDRIVGLIKAKILEGSLSYINDICTQCKNDSGLKLEVEFTRYEKGSSVARFILIGLGQIHIDANVSLVDIATGIVLTKTEASKTFAWGGIYGGATNIEDIEPAFAEAVVDILKQDKKKDESVNKAAKLVKTNGKG